MAPINEECKFEIKPIEDNQKNSTTDYKDPHDKTQIHIPPIKEAEKDNLDTPIIKEETPKSHKYKSESSDTIFSQKGSLKKEHIHKHHKGPRNCKCESCGKLFSNQWVLKNHIQSMMATKIISVNLVVNHLLEQAV